MTKKTFNRRLAQLIEEVKNHPNKDEIIRLATEQLAEDTHIVIPSC